MKKMTSIEIKYNLVEILKYIDSVCKKNNIKYYLAYGTLLGAVRHHGFIPWDDDIDIFVPRSQYELLKERIIDEKKYGIDDISTNKKYKLDYYKVIDKTTQISEKTNVIMSSSGLFVDIFPLDGFGCSIEEAKYNLKRLQRYKLKIKYANTKKLILKNLSFKEKIKKTIAFLYSKTNCFFGGTKRLINKYNKIALKVDYDSSLFVGYVDMDGGFMPFSKVYSKDWFEGECLVEFEGNNFKAPLKYKKILECQYGSTYMELPPVENRISHNIEAYKG